MQKKRKQEIGTNSSLLVAAKRPLANSTLRRKRRLSITTHQNPESSAPQEKRTHLRVNTTEI